MIGGSHHWIHACARSLTLALAFTAACGGSSSESPYPLPATPILLGTETARGLSNPKEIMVSGDERHLLILERGAGRLALLDLASGELNRIPGFFVGLVSEGNGATALTLQGQAAPEDYPPSTYTGPTISGGLVRRVTIASGDSSTLEASISGRGFLGDAGAKHLFVWNGGIDRIDVATGARERLDTCAELLPAAVDPSGRWLYETSELSIPYISQPQGTLRRCDLTDGSLVDGAADGRAETLSFGCGGTVLFRGHTPGVASDAAAPGYQVVFDGLDPVTLERVTTVQVPSDLSLGDPVGPLATNASCDHMWFAAGSDVFEYDATTHSATRLVSGMGAPAALTLDGDGSSAIVADPRPASDRLRRIELANGADLPPPYAGTLKRPFGVWDALSLAWLDAPRELVLVTAHSFQDRLTRVVSSNVSRVDLDSGALTPGVAQSNDWAVDLASCDGGRELVAAGEFPSYAPSSPTAVIPPDAIGFGHEPAPQVRGAGRDGPTSVDYAYEVELAARCGAAYLLADRVYEVDRSAHRARELTLGDWASDVVRPTAIALDPTGQLLFLTVYDSLIAMNLHTHEVTQVAILEPDIEHLAVTATGQIVFTGLGNTALGLVDLATGQAQRLWEGAGRSFWARDRP